MSLNRRPYWIEVDPSDVYGWRLDRESNYGRLIQIRIGEKAIVPDGDFGEKVYDQIRVIEPGRYRIYRQEQQQQEMQGGFPYPTAFDQTDPKANYELIEEGPCRRNSEKINYVLECIFFLFNVCICGWI